VTTSHHVLVCGEGNQWLAPKAGDLHQGQHRLFIHSREAMDDIEATNGRHKIQSVRKFVECCKVLEFQLENVADAVLLQLSEGIFTAVFGSPGWSSFNVQVKNMSIDLVELNDERLATRSSNSDPTHSRHKAPVPIYCRIARPHDSHCAAWCKFHFTEQGCKKGQLCMMCHSADHILQAQQRKTHRGKHEISHFWDRNTARPQLHFCACARQCVPRRSFARDSGVPIVCRCTAFQKSI